MAVLLSPVKALLFVISPLRVNVASLFRLSVMFLAPPLRFIAAICGIVIVAVSIFTSAVVPLNSMRASSNESVAPFMGVTKNISVSRLSTCAVMSAFMAVAVLMSSGSSALPLMNVPLALLISMTGMFTPFSSASMVSFPSVMVMPPSWANASFSIFAA